MKGLFTKISDVEKGAYWSPVPEDSAEWPKQAINEFLAEYPEFTNQDLQVQFSRKDPKKGYAVGAIVFSKRSIAVPIIIKEFKLAGFDVIVAANRLMPLTRENLFTLFTDKSAYGDLQPLDSNQDFISRFDPALRAASGWSGGGESYSLKAGEYSFIDRVSNSVTSTAKMAVLSAINDNNDIKNKLKHNDNYDIVEKIASLKETNKVDVEKTLSHALERDVHYIYKTGADTYKGIFGSSQAYDPIIMDLTKEEASKFEPINFKGYDRRHIAEADSIKAAVAKIDGDENHQIVVTSRGEYAEIKDSNLSKLGSYCEVISDKQPIPWLNGEVPQAGSKYILKIGGQFTRPTDVMGTEFFNNQFKVHTFNGLEKKSYYITKGINKIFKHEREKNAYYLPDSVSWIKINGNYTPEPPRIDIANEITKISDMNYRLEGPVLSKYAKEIANKPEFDFHDTIWALMQTKASREDLAKVASLKQGETMRVNNLILLPSLKKFAELLYKKYDELFVDLKMDASEIVKIAATSPLKTTVDAVLSLGFINKDNIQEYVAQIPMYEQVCSDLAKLLLYIRLGMESMSEDPVREAMKYLTRVVERLRGLSKLSKVE